MQLLRGIIRNYEWGNTSAIAGILGHTPTGVPEAEYWLGAHPSAPSELVGTGTLLDKAVADQSALLGEPVTDRFGGIPFLLKILAAAQPLSIQAHPNAAQARSGFEREDDAGIARNASHRNYRDPNHKPELICALSPFEGKCGFRGLEETRSLLKLFGPTLENISSRLAESGSSVARSEGERLSAVVSDLLGLESGAAKALADATVAAASELTDAGSDLGGFEAEIEWTIRIGETYPGDVGVVVALLLNHFTLRPGEAIFLPAGNLHAYLEGVGVELMANSDNVLRGGLTPKHVDVAELLSVVDWEPNPPPVQVSAGPIHRFDTPVSEFELTRFDSGLGEIDTASLEPVGPEVVLVTDGSVVLETSESTLTVGRGQAAFISPLDRSYRLRPVPGENAVAWRAAVPLR